jgi:hypothetical protein
MRRACYTIFIALCGCLAGVVSARADHQPALVVPGNREAPVIIDGYDVSWAVAEGEWGLYRPGHGTPAVIYPYPVLVPLGYGRGYFPATGKRPRYGRYEIIPPANRRLPPPAESFHRFWSSPPAGISEYPSFEPPPVIMAPRLQRMN